MCRLHLLRLHRWTTEEFVFAPPQSHRVARAGDAGRRKPRNRSRMGSDSGRGKQPGSGRGEHEGRARAGHGGAGVAVVSLSVVGDDHDHDIGPGGGSAWEKRQTWMCMLSRCEGGNVRERAEGTNVPWERQTTEP